MEEVLQAPLVDREIIVELHVSGDLAAFLQRGIEDVERYCKRMASPEARSEELAREAHSLKGTSGTLGLTRISQLAGVIEARAQEGNSVGHLAAELRDVATATYAELQALGLFRCQRSSRAPACDG